MNLFELSIFALHLSSLSLMIYLIKLFERQQVLHLKEFEVTQTEEEFAEEEFEEPLSEEESDENPNLRHRKEETVSSAMEMVD